MEKFQIKDNKEITNSKASENNFLTKTKSREMEQEKGQEKKIEPHTLFQNLFTLRFVKDYIQQKYDERVYQSSTAKLVYFLFTFVCQITIYTFYSLNKKSITNITRVKFIDILSIIEFALLSISLVLYILKSRHIIISMIYNYFFLMSFNLMMTIGNFFLDSLVDEEITNYYLYFRLLAVFTMRICYIIIVDTDFIRSFVICLLWILGGFTFYIMNPILDQAIKMTKICGTQLILTIIAYFYDKHCRKLFYFNKKFENQKDFYFNILDNMQSGLLIYDIKKKKVKFVNKYLSNYEEFKKKESIKNLISIRNREENNIDKNQEVNDFQSKEDRKQEINKVFESYNIFNQVNDINKILPNEVVEFMRLSSFYESADNIFKFYEENSDKSSARLKDSIFIGYLKLQEKGKSNLFEFYLRKIEIEENIYLEFLLTNVTYTIKFEDEKIKAKTQILARISHEFKNPLIVTNEVVEEMEEKLIKNEYNSLKEDIKFIKNINEYILLLIKNFEVINSIENNYENPLYPTRFNMTHFVKDIKDIVEALIKKKNSGNLLKFIVYIDDAIEYFTTDALRLKQIVINLISNAIKFTEKGIIELKVEKLKESRKLEGFNVDDDNLSMEENKKIRISVIDNGNGISQEKRNNLFGSVSKEISSENIFGSGYGLGIVMNMCEKLGSKINYMENLPKGSLFYFDLLELESIASEPVLEILEFKEKIDCNSQSQIDNNNKSQISSENSQKLSQIDGKSPASRKLISKS